MEIFMKRVIPKLLLFFCLIPWGAAMIFTVIDCIFNIMYLDWLWIPDWCMKIFNLLSYYTIELMLFSLFGIFSAHIFYGKAYKAVLLTALAFAGTVVFPLTRYFVGHMLLTGTMYDTAMLAYFNENWLFAENLLLNAILFLIAVLLTKLFASVVFKNPGRMPEKMLSLRNPLNLAALIFCSAAVIMASILFISVGELSFESVLSLLVEYLINAVRFFVIAGIAFIARKGMRASDPNTGK